MFKLCGKVGLPGGQHDQTVNMAVYQRLDALNLRGLIAADAQQQLLRIHVDDGFDFVKQLRAERVVGGRNHQADGVGAVSYTHLDVYKRQQSSETRISPRICWSSRSRPFLRRSRHCRRRIPNNPRRSSCRVPHNPRRINNPRSPGKDWAFPTPRLSRRLRKPPKSIRSNRCFPRVK